MDKVRNYALTNFKNGKDIMPLFTDMKDPMPSFKNKHKTKTISEEDKKDSVEVDIYQEKIKMYVSREHTVSKNVEKAYGLMWGQCSAALQVRIEGCNNFKNKSNEKDAL